MAITKIHRVSTYISNFDSNFKRPQTEAYGILYYYKSKLMLQRYTSKTVRFITKILSFAFLEKKIPLIVVI